MKNKNQMSKRIWSFGIMLCLVLALGCLIFASVLGNTPRGSVERTVAATPEVSYAPDVLESVEPVATPTPNPIQKIDSPAALAQTDPASGDYVNGMYFLGDSALKLLNEETLLAGPEKEQQVWCPESGVMDMNTLSSVTFVSPVTGNNAPFGDIAFVNRPETMILLPSTDNANLITQTSFKAALKAVVESIQAESPETKIIFSSLTPVARSYQYEDITFEVINRVNQWIAEAAEENGVKYLDAAFELAGTDGFLPENFQNGDGMHLSADGLKAWFDCVRTHVYP